MFNFYRELKQVCNLRPPVECSCYNACFSPAEELSIDEEQVDGLTWLQTLAQEENLDNLQLQLFMREIQRLNPNLEDGCLFVDGLYELVCSRMPVDARVNASDKSLKNGARDLLTVHNSGQLLLQKYWHKPDDLAEQTPYLTVASSFVQYILSTYGPEGVSQFLRQLDCHMVDPQAENFRFKRRNILTLEFKWKKFIEAQVSTKYRLTTMGMLRVLFQKYLIAYWFRILLVFLIIFADIALHLFFAIASVKLLAYGFYPGPLLPILKWTGFLLAAILARFGIMNVSIVLQSSVAVNVSNNLRRKLSARMHMVTPKFLTDHSTSSVISTFLQDVNTIEAVIAYGIRTMLFGTLMFLALIVFSLILAWPIGIPLAFIFIGSQILVHFISSRLSDHSFAKGQATNKLTDIMKEEIDGFAVNKLYRLGDLWQSQMSDTIRMHYTPKAKRSLFLTKFVLLFQFLVPNVIGTLLTLGIIVLRLYERISIEDGLAIFIFFSTVTVALTSASTVFPQIQAAATSMGRINSLLNNRQHDWKDNDNKSVSEEEEERDHKTNLSIEFKHVSFSYEVAASHWNLYDVSLEIKPGERVAVVGQTGSGKSTLLQLVLQMFKPVHGEVIIGDEEGTQMRVAATFQNNHMFNMSIRENIRVGNLQATDDEVTEAAKLADIHTWIMSLPRGYDSAVQAGGRSLSGGQRQRIAIARMLVTKAPILVLDEVTSALDPATETRVFEKLMEITTGRTVIAVTHRLVQAKEFDYIVVLSHGRVKEVGTHTELLTHHGPYWRMWNNAATNTSPGMPVPIIRRTSSMRENLQKGSSLKSLQNPLPASRPGSIPNLSIVPFSAMHSTPVDGAIPPFTPLHTMLETGQDSDIATSAFRPTRRRHSSSCIPDVPELTIIPLSKLETPDKCLEEVKSPKFTPLTTLMETIKENSKESRMATSGVSSTAGVVAVTEDPVPLGFSTPIDNFKVKETPIIVVHDTSRCEAASQDKN